MLIAHNSNNKCLGTAAAVAVAAVVVNLIEILCDNTRLSVTSKLELNKTKQKNANNFFSNKQNKKTR